MWKPRKNIKELGLGRYLARSLMTIGVKPNLAFRVSKICKTVCSPRIFTESLFTSAYTKFVPRELSICKTKHYLKLRKGLIPEIDDFVREVDRYFHEHRCSFYKLPGDHYTYLINPLRQGCEEKLMSHEKALLRSMLTPPISSSILRTLFSKQ